jgi:hypothetical protein
MIITWLTGGLGNQMFQYAAGLALAEKRRTVLKLDVSWYRDDPAYEAHNRYGLSCFNITEQFATAEETERLRGVPLTRTERWTLPFARLLRLRRYEAWMQRPSRIFQEAAITGNPTALATLPDDTYLHGMWQSEDNFPAVAPLLRQHFTLRYPLSAAAQACAAAINAARPAIAVHFRRGDYARNPVFSRDLGVLGPDYYASALRHIRSTIPDATLFVFSDDIDAVQREFAPGVPCHFYRSPSPLHAPEKLHLMSLCDHAVISNSTFAWWGAWLHTGNPTTRTVIAPEPWFANPALDGTTVVPRTWTRLARSA